MDERERAELWPLARRVAPAVGVRVNAAPDIMVFVSTTDNEIGRKYFTRGEFEGEVLRRACAQLDTLGRPLKDRVFLDIGAHVGSASVLAYAVHGAASVVAFEPDSDNFSLLCANLAMNEVEGVPVPVALGETPGRFWLERDDANHGAHRLVSRPPSADPGRQPVAVMSFDESATVNAIDPSDVGLAWIDVEGHEWSVLRGATRLLAAKVPLAFEFWPGAMQPGPGPLQALLHDAGYQEIYDLRCANCWSVARPLTDLAEIAQEVDSVSRVLTEVLVV